MSIITQRVPYYAIVSRIGIFAENIHYTKSYESTTLKSILDAINIGNEPIL